MGLEAVDSTCSAAYTARAQQNSTTFLGSTLPVGGPRCLVASSLILLLRFLRLNSDHRYQVKSGPPSEPFKETNSIIVHHGVPENDQNQESEERRADETQAAAEREEAEDQGAKEPLTPSETQETIADTRTRPMPQAHPSISYPSSPRASFLSLFSFLSL
jgi:hypothetical protein